MVVSLLQKGNCRATLTYSQGYTIGDGNNTQALQKFLVQLHFARINKTRGSCVKTSHLFACISPLDFQSTMKAEIIEGSHVKPTLKKNW